MRLFGSERIMGIMDRLGWEEDQVIDHPQISRGIENAQKRVESRHFEMRKQVLEYDDVMNQQREVIYAQRRGVLLNENISQQIEGLFDPVFRRLVSLYTDEKTIPEEWDLDSLQQQFTEIVGRPLPRTNQELGDLLPEQVVEELVRFAQEAYAKRAAEYGAELQRQIEKVVLLQITDQKWMDHLSAMDDLREGIGLRALAQRDPLLEYRFEAYQMFHEMVSSIQEDTISMLFKVRLAEEKNLTQPKDRLAGAQTNQGEGSQQKPRKVEEKVGRNDPCPCGSGKKYKKCHGR